MRIRVLALALFSVVLMGCATHGQVNIPVQLAVEHQAFQGKSFSSEVLYSQPKPGIFSNGEQLELKPIQNAELSIGAARVLSRFKDLFMRQLPAEASLGNTENSDYKFVVQLFAKNKRGPSYADFDAMLSTGKKMLTLGLGASEYTIVADFDVTYQLLDSNNNLLFEKSYEVDDKVDHERGGFDSYDIGDDLAAKLLEKHIVLSMNDFFKATTQVI